MLTIRNANARGKVQTDWLDSRHSFSFGSYYDPEHMGFGPLRVLNEDKVIAAGGFDEHGHENMEIVSYVLEGTLKHEDSMGNSTIIQPGEIQRMSAGTGVRHSEFNPSKTQQAHFLQIWFLPEEKGIAPSYAQQAFKPQHTDGQLNLVASRDAREGSISIHQDVDIYVGKLNGDDVVRHDLKLNRLQWLQVAKGSLYVNGQSLQTGDGLAIEQESKLILNQAVNAEILLFDMVRANHHR